jgi:hypothetical protein
MFKQVVTINHPLISRQTTVPQQRVTSVSAPKFLQMLLAALVWTTYQAVAKCRLMQVMKQLVSASGHLIQFFSCRDKKPSSGE